MDPATNEYWKILLDARKTTTGRTALLIAATCMGGSLRPLAALVFLKDTNLCKKGTALSSQGGQYGVSEVSELRLGCCASGDPNSRNIEKDIS